MNRPVIRLALSMLFHLVCGISLVGLGGCSGGGTPPAEAVKKAFSKRFDEPDRASRDKGRLPGGSKR